MKEVEKGKGPNGAAAQAGRTCASNPFEKGLSMTEHPFGWDKTYLPPQSPVVVELRKRLETNGGLKGKNVAPGVVEVEVGGKPYHVEMNQNGLMGPSYDVYEPQQGTKTEAQQRSASKAPTEFAKAMMEFTGGVT
ncbi:Uncharacterised protein [Candidatus Burarchaeum australiense]|nr:Uncharacterised protein [Candidatus Burarchaeum australiense]